MDRARTDGGGGVGREPEDYGSLGHAEPRECRPIVGVGAPADDAF